MNYGTLQDKADRAGMWGCDPSCLHRASVCSRSQYHLNDPSPLWVSGDNAVYPTVSNACNYGLNYRGVDLGVGTDIGSLILLVNAEDVVQPELAVSILCL